MDSLMALPITIANVKVSGVLVLVAHLHVVLDSGRSFGYARAQFFR